VRNVVALAVLQATACIALVQSNQEAASYVKLVARTRDGQTTFHIGEVIPLELSFTSSAEKKYQLDMATYDRSGRLREESFAVEPRTGWVDPLDLYFRAWGGFMGGGGRGIQVLSAKPMVVYEELNEWVRFEKPGEYRVTVRSSRASTLDSPFSGNGAPAVSNELRLTIVAATPAWQQQTLQQAVAGLDAPLPADWPIHPGQPDSHRDASKALRYLGTAAGAREMAHRTQYTDFRMGLAGSPAREAGLDEMKKLLRDPNAAIDIEFLNIMSVLALPDGPGQRWKERQDTENGFRQELISLLSLKQGAARATSTKTILDSSEELPAELKQELAKAMTANFDSLTVAEQADLIQYRLKALDRETLLPLLRKAAQRYQDFPEPREMNAWNFNQASGSALQQWYAAAPEEARPAVLLEILRPEPRFGAKVLGMLPDRELPGETPKLVEHLKAAKGSDTFNLASLIYRYADASAEPEVLSYLDPSLGKGACDIQDWLLAWLLKVDPDSARPRLETVMAARKDTGCFTSLMVEVGDLQDSPILQEMALKALNDPDMQLVANAAAYLGNHGTAAAEDTLWARFTAWHERWAGHEAELRYIPGGSTDVQWESGAGQNMLRALGSGQGWLASEDQLRRLIALAVGTTQRQQAEQLLKTWQTTPWTIQFTGMGHFQIAQYQATSLDLAKAKLLQFPKGTEFRLGVNGQDGEAEVVKQLSGFLEEHGLAIRRER
jgi:hypothetical protein